MIDYWRSTENKDEAKLWFERMWEAFHDTRTWNLCISGSDENWNDVSNELTWLVLDCCAKYKYQTPNVTMRIHRNTPEALWQRATEVISTGIGMPALYNDEVVCVALEKMGIPACHSHLYCMNGCNQIDIMGKSHMGLEDGEVNFGKVLEFTMHNGYDFASGGVELISNQYGDPRNCETFDEFLALFYQQMEHVTDACIRMSNAAQETFARFNPNPLRSCIIQGCLEKGRDYKWGGPLYGHGQVLAEGIADTADALYALKTLVFEQKKYAMDEMIASL
jgi:formate C-acetyltransferase